MSTTPDSISLAGCRSVVQLAATLAGLLVLGVCTGLIAVSSKSVSEKKK